MEQPVTKIHYYHLLNKSNKLYVSTLLLLLLSLHSW